MVRSKQMQQMFKSETVPPAGVVLLLWYISFYPGSDSLLLINFSSQSLNSSSLLLHDNLPYFFANSAVYCFYIGASSFCPGVLNGFLFPLFIYRAILLKVSMFSKTWSRLWAPFKNTWTDLNFLKYTNSDSGIWAVLLCSYCIESLIRFNSGLFGLCSKTPPSSFYT